MAKILTKYENVSIYKGDKFWEHSGFWEVISFNSENKTVVCKLLAIKKDKISRVEIGNEHSFPVSYAVVWIVNQCRSPRIMYVVLVDPQRYYCSPIMRAKRQNTENTIRWVTKDGIKFGDGTIGFPYLYVNNSGIITILCKSVALAAAFIAGVEAGLDVAHSTVNKDKRLLLSNVAWSKDYWEAAVLAKSK